MVSAAAVSLGLVHGPTKRLTPPWKRIELVLLFSLAQTESRARFKAPPPTQSEIPFSEPDRDLLLAVFAEYPHATRNFSILVQAHWGRVWTICQSVLMNEHDAEEIAQDAFLKAHRYLPTFRFECRFSTWMNRIAHNAALTRLASRRRDRAAKERVTEDPTLAVWWLPRKSPDPAGQSSAMRVAFERLSPEDRFLLGLRELEGREYEEVADLLGVGQGAARMRVSRARERLRQSLARVQRGERTI